MLLEKIIFFDTNRILTSPLIVDHKIYSKWWKKDGFIVL